MQQLKCLKSHFQNLYEYLSENRIEAKVMQNCNNGEIYEKTCRYVSNDGECDHTQTECDHTQRGFECDHTRFECNLGHPHMQ
jgi:hypothetical protein